MWYSEQLHLRYPAIFAAFPKLAAVESTRHGGISQAPYQSLNLGLHTNDDPAAVLENRRRFFAACGYLPERTAGSHQIHGAEILTVTEPGYFEGFDALITRQSGILLTVTIADCTPILLFDPKKMAVAAVHAGWKGTAAGILRKTLEAMQSAYGSRAEDCLAYIGTCIDHCDFEVDSDVADHFTGAHKQWDEQRGKYMVNLKQANRSQLLKAGVPETQIQLSPYSTFTEHRDYFSHRFEKGRTGRMLAAIGLRS